MERRGGIRKRNLGRRERGGKTEDRKMGKGGGGCSKTLDGNLKIRAGLPSNANQERKTDAPLTSFV
jgi:hypothetical protein